MYDYEASTRAYLNDPLFRAVVDSLESALWNLHLTPADLRAIVTFACARFEERGRRLKEEVPHAAGAGQARPCGAMHPCGWICTRPTDHHGNHRADDLSGGYFVWCAAEKKEAHHA